MSASSPPVTARAEGVDYFTIPGADLRMFHCTDQAATLSTRGCAARFDAAQRRGKPQEGDDPNACYGCAIGAVHAGRELEIAPSSFGSHRCPRCTFANRMIGNRVCVNCYNREMEARRGRNTRGNPPSRLPPFVELPMRYAVDGELRPPEVRVVAKAHLANVKTGDKDRKGKPVYMVHERGGIAEAALQLLRITRGRVDLTMSAWMPPIAFQGSLFA